MSCDTVFKNAHVHDGERFLPTGTEIGVEGGRLRIAPGPGLLTAKETTDAKGLVLSPTLIDTHSHGDLRAFSRSGVNLLAQGCGTVIVGQCGFSPWGECGNHPVFLEEKPAGTFKGAAEYFAALSASRNSLEIFSFAGLHALMPLDGGADDRLRKAMDAGCVGLSVGLNYSGQLHTTTDDIIRLAKVLKEYEGRRWAGIAWHMRNPGDKFDESVNEIIKVHERTGVPCHVNHFKRNGLKNPGAVDAALALFDKYPAVTAEMYPYDVSWTMLEYLISQGAALVGKNAPLELKASAGCGTCCPVEGWHDVVPVSGVPPEWRGKSVAELAEKQEMAPEKLCADIFSRAPSTTACYRHTCLPSDYESVIRWKRGYVGGDGHLYDAGEPGHHPRSFGALAGSFRLLVDNKWLTEEAAIAKLTGEPRRALRIPGGRIVEGAPADLCLWDTGAYKANATLDSSNKLASGVKAVYRKGRRLFHQPSAKD